MKYLQDSDPRFQYLGLKVTSFLASLVLLLLVMAALLGWRQDFFVSTVVFRSKPGRADAIFPGMDVTLHGIRIGRVIAVDFDEAGGPEITMRVRAKPTVWLRANAVARLTGLDPLATPFIDLVPGSSDQPPLRPGALVPFERELSFGEATSRIQQELSPVVASASQLMAELNGPEGDVRKSLHEVHELSVSLAQDVPPILRDLQVSASTARGFLTEVTASDADLRRAARHLSSVSDTLDRRLPELVAKLDQSLTSLRGTTAELQHTAHTASPQVENLVRQSGDVVKKADELLIDVRKIWFLKLFAPHKEKPVEPRRSGP
ncbi:MAG: MlaD family protein [Verrucomicrobiota bacterium]